MLIMPSGMGEGDVAPAIGAGDARQEALASKVERLQKQMQGRVKEEMMKQAATQTAIALALMCVPFPLGAILGALYTLISLPGSLYVKQRSKELANDLRERLTARGNAAQDIISARQRQIQEEVWDEALVLAASGEPLEGLGDLGATIFDRVAKGAKTVIHAAARAPLRVARQVQQLPKTVVKLVTRPDQVLRAAMKDVQKVTNPVFEPLEKPVGFVWKPITRVITAPMAATTWVAGQTIIQTTRGVFLLAGDKKRADKWQDKGRDFTRFSRERLWKRSAATIQQLDTTVEAVRKLGQYVIGTASLEEVKDKLAQIEANANKLIAEQLQVSLDTLATPEAREHIKRTLATMMRETPQGRDAMELNALALKAAIYNQNGLISPEQIVGEPSFFDSLKEGVRVVSGTAAAAPLPTYASETAAGVGQLAPYTYQTSMQDTARELDLIGYRAARDGLSQLLSYRITQHDDAWRTARAMRNGPARDLALSSLERGEPAYEREIQQARAQISSMDDQLAAMSRELSASRGVAPTVPPARTDNLPARSNAPWIIAAAALTAVVLLTRKD
jgi:hypothetical protein